MNTRRIARFTLSLTLNLFGLIAVANDATAQTALPAPAAAAAETAEIDTFVRSLEGAWLGAENVTPFGPMDFAMVFGWNDAGELHSHSPLNSETYIDVRFIPAEDGRWLLREEAAMEGLGVQSHVLAPAGRTERGTYQWVYEEKPGYLSIEVGVIDDQMHFDVMLRESPHVAFRLARQSAEVRDQIAAQFEKQKALTPEEGVSFQDAMANSAAQREQNADPNDPIALARAAVDEDPKSATARLALAQQFAAAIEENPANGPRYAFEMLESLQKAIALDPELTPAYEWLANYYLNAPPIAGGSIERAAEVAESLDEYDADGAGRIRALVDQHRAERGGSN